MSQQPPPGPGGPGPYGPSPYGPGPYGPGPSGAVQPYAPPYGAPQHQGQRPGTVTAAGVITVVLGGLGIAGAIGTGLLIALFGALLGQIAESKSPGEGAGVTGAFVAVGLGVALIAMLIAVAYLMLGLRVLRGGSLARVLLTVVNALSAVAGLLGLVVAFTETDDVGLLYFLTSVAALAPQVVVIVLLWTGGASAWFASRR